MSAIDFLDAGTELRRRDVMGRIASSSFRTATSAGQVEHWRGYLYDVAGRVEAAHEAGTTPNALPSGHAQPAIIGPQVESAGTSVSSTRWAYLREEAVGSIVAIEDAQGARRFAASGSHTTPNGKWSARGPGYRLEGFDVGQVGRQLSHDEAGRAQGDGHQDYVFDDEGLLAKLRSRKRPDS